MPITIPSMAAQIKVQLNARTIIGAYSQNLAMGVATGTASFIQTLVVQTNDTGTAGAGVGTGKVIIEPASGTGYVTAQMMAAGLVGRNHPLIAQGIAFGIAIEIGATALVQTAVTGVAVGAGIGRIINAEPGTATSLIYAGLTSQGLVGNKVMALANALGTGIATWLNTATITTVVAGTPVIPPVVAQGVGVGKIL